MAESSFDGTVGIITYDAPHLKTQEVATALAARGLGPLRFFALPFKPRKPRAPLIAHRPDQSAAPETRRIAKELGAEFIACADDSDIAGGCAVYLVTGAGILSAACVAGKRILNAHPGVVPAVRGLDAFKWAIHDDQPLGVTLHVIDAEVDAGEVLAVVPTPVGAGDTVESLAARHYALENDVLIHFDAYLADGTNPYDGIAMRPNRLRMPREAEEEMVGRFPAYVAKWSRDPLHTIGGKGRAA